MIRMRLNWAVGKYIEINVLTTFFKFIINKVYNLTEFIASIDKRRDYLT